MRGSDRSRKWNNTKRPYGKKITLQKYPNHIYRTFSKKQKAELRRLRKDAEVVVSDGGRSRRKRNYNNNNNNNNSSNNNNNNNNTNKHKHTKSLESKIKTLDIALIKSNQLLYKVGE